MQTLREAYGGLIEQIVSASPSTTHITKDTVFQKGMEKAEPFIDKAVNELLLPGSELYGYENAVKLAELSAQGKSCMLLPEHYSNFDLSILLDMLRKQAGGDKIASRVVSIAGMKLNEDNSKVASIAGIYTRIVICPNTTMSEMLKAGNQAEVTRGRNINREAIRVMNTLKGQGKIILMFPSGTRFRPWNPRTKEAVHGIDSYLRVFDYFCPVALNGKVLHIRRDGTGDMLDDYVSRELVLCTIGPVTDCAAFRKRALAGVDDTMDKKAVVAHAITQTLQTLHESAEQERKRLLADNSKGIV
jgi:glycerol-3-phosphate O-acyltransferase